MKPGNAKIHVVLAIVLIFFAAPLLLHPAEFKIKPALVTGDLAPNGTLLDVGEPELNRRGEILVLGRTSFSDGGNLYLLNGGSLNLLLNSGDYFISQRIPDPQSLGFIQASCPFGPTECAFLASQSIEFYQAPNGNFIRCAGKVSLPDLSSGKINDSRDIQLPRGNVIAGGIIISYGCPTFTGFSHTIFEGRLFEDSNAIGIANSGAVAHKVGYQRRSTDVTHNDIILLLKGGGLSILNLMGAPAPGGGIIHGLGNGAMNENETILVPFFTSVRGFPGQPPDGLFLLREGLIVPVAWKGMAAPGGRKFQSFSGWVVRTVGLNDIEQVVFVAFLDDGRTGIFRRDPDGTFTVLRENFGEFFPTTLSINQRGDVAARIFRFFSQSEIFFFASMGGSVRVVGTGDPAPGGGTFQALGHPQVNSKGEIIFWARLSDGRSGIFLASSGLQTEFVDPVPDLLAGDTVTSDATELAKMGRVVTGIAADGAARVVVRVKTGQTGTAEFSLVDESGASLPASNFNGFLSQVSEELGSGSVSVPATDVEGFGPMAFAAYHAPVDFAMSPNSVEAGKTDRQVFIKVKLRTETGETIESTQPIKIIRPPVVLVHGLWESPSDWNAFTPLVNDSNLFVKRANYNFSITGITDSTPEFSPEILAKTTTNALGFTFNASFVLGQIVGFINDFKISQEVAAIQVDIVAHSMGGNVARNLPLIQGFFSNKTLGNGSIHKIITVGTPHLGTPLATQLLKNANSCVRDLLAGEGNVAFRSVTFQGRTFGGGVFELEGDGVGGQLSPALRRLQQPGRRLLPTALIAGIMSRSQLNGLLFSFRASGIQNFCSGDPLADSLNPPGWPGVFGQDSDAIVPLTSQLNGLQGLVRTAVHSSGTRKLGFGPPDEYQEASGIPTAVTELLNTSVTSTSFHLLPP